MGKFVKLYEKDDDQIAMIISETDDGMPEVRTFFVPDGLGVCSLALSFDDTDSGRDSAKKYFNEMTEDVINEIVVKVKEKLIG